MNLGGSFAISKLLPRGSTVSLKNASQKLNEIDCHQSERKEA
jgi:hypothetical protein